jgi:hypothetical protein
MECYRERVPYDLKDIAVIRLNGLMEDFMVTRKKRWHFIWMLLREFGTAFYISKQERYSAGR